MLSPAKINLGLEIFHRRPSDGYHYLASIFIPISFGDEMRFWSSLQPSLSTINELRGSRREDFERVSERGNPSANLVWKALETVMPHIPEGIGIELIKRIPPGAGLGGGSSNAALLLRYAGERYALPRELLQSLALSLGADLPFFLSDGPALVTGIGEHLSPISLGPGLGVLCLPEVGINTKAAYANLKRSLQDRPHPKTLSQLDGEIFAALEQSRWERIAPLRNHFEEVIFPEYPVLKRVKDSFLNSGSLYASLTGSGAALYGLVKSEEEQKGLLARMKEEFPDFQFVPFHF